MSYCNIVTDWSIICFLISRKYFYSLSMKIIVWRLYHCVDAIKMKKSIASYSHRVETIEDCQTCLHLHSKGTSLIVFVLNHWGKEIYFISMLRYLFTIYVFPKTLKFSTSFVCKHTHGTYFFFYNKLTTLYEGNTCISVNFIYWL